MTPSVSSKGRCNASIDSKGLTLASPSACTTACTSKPENDNADALADLAKRLLELPAADRARLAELLASKPGGKVE